MPIFSSSRLTIASATLLLLATSANPQRRYTHLPPPYANGYECRPLLIRRVKYTEYLTALELFRESVSLNVVRLRSCREGDEKHEKRRLPKIMRSERNAVKRNPDVWLLDLLPIMQDPGLSGRKCKKERNENLSDNQTSVRRPAKRGFLGRKEADFASDKAQGRGRGWWRPQTSEYMGPRPNTPQGERKRKQRTRRQLCWFKDQVLIPPPSPGEAGCPLCCSPTAHLEKSPHYPESSASVGNSPSGEVSNPNPDSSRSRPRSPSRSIYPTEHHPLLGTAEDEEERKKEEKGNGQSRCWMKTAVNDMHLPFRRSLSLSSPPLPSLLLLIAARNPLPRMVPGPSSGCTDWMPGPAPVFRGARTLLTSGPPIPRCLSVPQCSSITENDQNANHFLGMHTVLESCFVVFSLYSYVRPSQKDMSLYALFCMEHRDAPPPT
ncbi:uncharacterized protein CLUP02_10325 [Colletotrichum lupini]|uniref:Uncharacterized protein n=1 Tax=Colletotrichum lupini TaxID=145971 RepID=A0A9Q8SWI4_9PEZI|nr:uncharacterized protein CLUP02_10325 [Colletotrichum lupini]UQC84829.1 hypothetical protein CLUP02_10325 [Colletotrichum lupini]